MKIILTGGGSAGHFYPLIAVAQKLNELAKENRLLKPELYYMSTDPFDENLLYENSITFIKVSAGKIRREKSLPNLILNFGDLFSTFLGVLSAIWKLFVIYPDAASYFKPEKTAYTGNPIRKEIEDPQVSGSHEYFKFSKDIPTVFVIGGSQGARFINSAIMDALPELVKRYQVIHQTGVNNLSVIQETSAVVLLNSQHKERYVAIPYLNALTLRMAAGAADVIVSRAGSTIFEIASWGRASIIIPIPEATSHDQKTNAYSYARSCAAFVIEEKNLAPGILLAEIERATTAEKEKMQLAAKNFSRRDSARLIAEELIAIGLQHER